MYSCRKYPKLTLFYVMFFSLFITQQSLAQEIVTNQVLQKKILKVKSINKGGVIYDLQKVDPMVLTEDVEKLREAFIQRKHELIQLVENKKLNVGDAIITILIPGGLFYAGYRKQELEKAKNDLLAVTSEIEELSNDLVALQTQNTTHQLMLAQLP